MKAKRPYDITLQDDELVMLTSPTTDITYLSLYTAAAGSDINDTAHSLIQSILDRIYRKENEMPYLFLQWVD